MRLLLAILSIIKLSKGELELMRDCCHTYYSQFTNRIIIQHAAQLCMNGTVRLQDGPTEFEGRVEVCLSEEWRTVCNDFWGHNEALVVCRQLGFATSGELTDSIWGTF